jgi:hypothetical protein
MDFKTAFERLVVASDLLKIIDRADPSRSQHGRA